MARPTLSYNEPFSCSYMWVIINLTAPNANQYRYLVRATWKYIE